MRGHAVSHPKDNLMMEAKIERDVADSAEAEALQGAIFIAVRAYSDFLEDRGVIWSEHDPDEIPSLKAQALVVTLDYGDGDNAIDIKLKNGPLDRVYGDGVDPDPFKDIR
jgi:hypothetical protein